MHERLPAHKQPTQRKFNTLALVSKTLSLAECSLITIPPQIVQQVFSPEEEGSHLVTLTMLGDYMPETIHHVTIAATEPRTRMNSFLN